MGQYYHPVCEGRKEYVYSHDFRNGLKLMEHSWLGNNFVITVESLLAPGQIWCQHKITWSGDYGDRAEELHNNPEIVKIRPAESEEEYPYLLNHTKKQYVDKNKIESVEQWGSTWRVHPLPLLTADGNGRGGGDFTGDDPNNLVGSWAGNRISVSKIKPAEDEWEELIFDLKE